MINQCSRFYSRRRNCFIGRNVNAALMLVLVSIRKGQEKDKEPSRRVT